MESSEINPGDVPSPAPAAPAARTRPKPAPSPTCTLERVTPDAQALVDAWEASGVGSAIQRDAAYIAVSPPGAPPPAQGPLTVAAPPTTPLHGPTFIAYWKICDGLATDLIWRPKPGPAAPTSTKAQLPQFVLQTLENRIQVPGLSVGLAPPSQSGITGLESYFWLAGYDGSPVARTTSNATYRIDLRATPSSYVWDFGDGSRATTDGPGAAYPQVSPVRHTYETRSDWSPLAVNGMYHVTVTIQFDTEFRVTGPGFTPNWVNLATYGLPPLTATSAQDYKVGEVVSALTGPSAHR